MSDRIVRGESHVRTTAKRGRVCRHGEIVLAGGSCARCRKEERERSRQRGNPKARAYGYNRKNWQQVRRARLELDGYLCRLRLPGCTLQATHVHLDPELGGNHDVATLADCVSACAQCSGAVDAPRARGREGGATPIVDFRLAAHPIPATRAL
jgi:hypothetical protein